MSKVERYHRPETIDEALQLLAEPNTAVLAGGTQLIPQLDEKIEAVVDLQAVALAQITVDAEVMTLGAMVRLQTLVDQPDVPELIRQMARREGPNTFRRMSTIGGTVATADWESELYAALLVHEAMVTMQTQTGEQVCSLAECSEIAGVVTAVRIKLGGQTASERVARTPADKPIVAVLGRKDDTGAVRLAFCGTAEKPALVTPKMVDQLSPPADFRGSSDYRRQMANVLSQRVLDQLGVNK